MHSNSHRVVTTVACIVVAAVTSTTLATSLPVVSTGTLLLHLDADEGVTVNGSNVITGATGWQDISGNGNHFGFADGAPTLVPSALNSQAVIRFNAADGTDRVVNFANVNLSSIQNDITIFAVTQNAANADGLFTSHGGGFGNTLRTAFGIVQVPGDNGAALGTDPTGSVTTIRISQQDDPGTPVSLAVRYYETFLRSNTASGLLGAFYSPGPGTAGVWQGTGIGDADGHPLTGDLAEFIIYSGALSEADRLAVETALGVSYNVPEPATITLLFLSSAGLFASRRRLRAAP